MKSIIFIAPPAAGKGTQSKLVSAKYNIPHISTGDLLRSVINSGSELGKSIKAEIDKGNLVSDELILDLLKTRLNQDDTKNGYILDGFPRNLNQAKEYDNLLKSLNKELGYVILLDLDKETAKNRITGRLSCKTCGSVYNEYIEESKPKNKGLCDKCNTELSKRTDDNEETFEERYNTYLKETEPLINYYENKGCLYRVNSGVSLDSVFEEIVHIIGSSK